MYTFFGETTHPYGTHSHNLNFINGRLSNPCAYNSSFAPVRPPPSAQPVEATHPDGPNGPRIIVPGALELPQDVDGTRPSNRQPDPEAHRCPCLDSMTPGAALQPQGLARAEAGGVSEFKGGGPHPEGKGSDGQLGLNRNEVKDEPEDLER